MLRRSIPAAQQVVLRIGGRELLTLHTNMFITWCLDGTKKLATENIMLEYALGAGNSWKIYKDLGNLDTVAIANG